MKFLIALITVNVTSYFKFIGLILNKAENNMEGFYHPKEIETPFSVEEVTRFLEEF